MCLFAVKCLWLNNRQMWDSKHFSGLIYSGEERVEELGNNHQIAQRRDIICSQLCPCFTTKRSCTECSRVRWAVGIWTTPATADSQLGLCSFQLKWWASAADTRQGAGSFLPGAARCQRCCSDPALTRAGGEEGLVWQKPGCEWVRACQAVAHGCSCCGDGTSCRLVRTTPALAWAGVWGCGCAVASPGMSPRAGIMPGLHSRMDKMPTFSPGSAFALPFSSKNSENASNVCSPV